MKKTGLIRVLRILLVAALTLSLFSCGEHDLPSLTGAHGVTIEGGGFKEGSALVVDRINIEESNGGIALAAIRNESYDKDGRVYIFNIYVLHGNERVQPTGRIKVTLPLPETQCLPQGWTQNRYPVKVCKMPRQCD